MGKAALLLVMASIMAMSLSYVTKDESQSNSAIERTNYEHEVLARETSESAYNIVISKVLNDFETYRKPRSSKAKKNDQKLKSGFYQYSAIEELDGSVTVVGLGMMGDHEYEITGTITRPDAYLFDALTLDGILKRADMKNNYLITGINASLAGRDVHAIRSTTQASYDEATSEMEAAQVTGVDGNMDILVGEPLLDLGVLGDQIYSYSGPKRIYYSGDEKFENGDVFGSSADPVVVIVDGKLEMKGDARGYGILYVSGKEMVMEGFAQWNGLVYMVYDGGKFEMAQSASVTGAVVLRSTAGGGNSGNSGGSTSDRGLIGGHFDVDVFGGDPPDKEYHEHQYDDKYDVTGVDVLAPGCKNGGMCWDLFVGSAGYNKYRVEFFNEAYGEGTYRIRLGSTEYTGSTEDGFSLNNADLSSISVFETQFKDLCVLQPSSPGDVQSDDANRNGAFTIRVYGYNGNYNPNSATQVYEMSAYHHTKDNDALCSSNSDPIEMEIVGDEMEFKMKNTASIVYSMDALTAISSLVPALNGAKSEPVARRLSEVRRLADNVTKKR